MLFCQGESLMTTPEATHIKEHIERTIDVQGIQTHMFEEQELMAKYVMPHFRDKQTTIQPQPIEINTSHG
jgi:hypothetical protein